MTTRRIALVDPGDTTGMQRIRTGINYAVNPRAGSGSIRSWSKANGSSGQDLEVTAETGTGPEGSDTFIRATLTDAPEAVGGSIICGGGAGSVLNLIDVGDIGKEFQTAIYVRSSRAAVVLRTAIAFYSTTPSNLGSQYSPTLSLDANEWTLLPIAKKVAPAGANDVRLYVNVQSTNLQVGDTLDIAAGCYRTDDIFTAEPVYRDGDSSGWTWAGTVHASRSTGIIGVA